MRPDASAALRWGVLGVAGIAVKRMLPALQRAATAEVVAIASRDGEKARAAAATHGIPRAYGSYDELLADGGVDAVYIPLPNHLHVPWTIRAADAGKHVLCEKPIALNAAQSRELLAVRERAGVHIAEAFMVRAHPQWLETDRLVQGDRIGALRHVHGHFSYYKVDADDIRSRAEYGGGALMDVGCYVVMIARWMFRAEPLRVLSLVERDPQMGVDRITSALLEFPTGRATFTCATQLVHHQRVQLFGTRGRLEVEIPFSAPADRACRILLDDGRDVFGSGVEVIETPPTDQFAAQVDRFAAAVRGVEPPLMTLEESVANMAAIDAIVRSAESGRWETPEHFS